MTRAFASWWAGGENHVLLVLAVYKKSHEDQFWRDANAYEEMAIDYHAELTRRREGGELVESLGRIGDDDRYRLLDA